jgi:hypothetical protein
MSRKNIVLQYEIDTATALRLELLYMRRATIDTLIRSFELYQSVRPRPARRSKVVTISPVSERLVS